MTTPYATPLFPRPPHPTPASALSNRLQKAPIYNPYDKFSQNEFNSWIGGITGALRKALGQDDVDERSVTSDHAADLFSIRDDETPEGEGEADQSEVEDSFAELKSRRDKGKARDPREGPGLGGDRLQPIELLYSDSEEEYSEGEEEIEEGSSDWREYDSDGERYSEGVYEGSEEEDDEGVSSSHRAKEDSKAEEIIELSSDEEKEEEKEDELFDSEYEVEDVDGRSSPHADAEYSPEVDKFRLFSSEQNYLEENDDEDGLIAEDEGYNEEAFPSRRTSSQAPELVDPWAGPQTYAEDFYSGGDIREGVLDPTLTSPSHLTPIHDERIWDDDGEKLLTQIPARKESTVIDVDRDEDGQGNSSILASSLARESFTRSAEHVDEDGQGELDTFEKIAGFLAEGARVGLLGDFESSALSPEIAIHTQAQTTQFDSAPISFLDKSAETTLPSVATSNRDLDWGWNFGPSFVVEDVQSGPGPNGQAPPMKGVPEVIEVEDDDEEQEGVDAQEEEKDEIDDYDEDSDNSDVAEVYQISSEDEDEVSVQEYGTTRDLLGDFLPAGGYLGANEIEDHGEFEVEEDMTDELAATELPIEDEPEELTGITQTESVDISARASHEVHNDLETISLDNSEQSGVEEVNEVTDDILPQLLLPENPISGTVEGSINDTEPTKDVSEKQPSPPTITIEIVQAIGDPKDVLELQKQPSPPVETETVQAIKPTVSFANNASENIEPTTDLVVETLSEDKATLASTVRESSGVPEDTFKFSEQSRDISVGPTGQEIHYTVSEVMTDDAARSTVPPEDIEIDIDIVSAAGDESVESMSYVIEEPVTEGRLTEEPPENEAIEESSADIIMDSGGRTEDDSGSSLSILEANSTAVLPDKPEGKPISLKETSSNPDNMSRTVTPLMATDEEKLFAEDRQSRAAELNERQDSVHGVCDTFPMPVLADPTVPDPTDISQELDIVGGSPMSTIPVNLPDLAVVTPDLTDDTQTLPPDPSTSGLFTPQDEPVSVPETPRMLLTDAITTEDIVQLTPNAEIERSISPIPDASSVPLETADSMETLNVETISTGILPAASTAADGVSPGSVVSPRMAIFSEAVTKEDDPFRLMGTDSKVAPGPVDSGSSSGGSEAEEQPFSVFLPDDDQSLTPEHHASENKHSNELNNGAKNQPGDNQAMSAESSYENGSIIRSGSLDRTKSLDSLESQPLRRSKRKRRPASLSLARRASTKAIDYKGKGKAKEEDEEDEAKTENQLAADAASENGSTASGATIARMLHLSSRNTSRASSIASSTGSSLQSPTLTKQTSTTNGRVNAPTLFHVHSGLHHDPPPAPLQPSPQTLKRTVSSSSQQATSQHSPSQRVAVTHSPVTRSMCRFHRISLPREENGPRVSFIIPGCSLGNGILMENEGIVDHGDATTLDHERMVGNIETLDFSSYLVGVLRQLVGVDLLRENEVFFLPQPGEPYGRKRHGKPKPTMSSGDFTAPASPQSTASSLRGSTSRVTLGPLVPRASLSVAGSTSTSAGSIRTKPRDSDRHSISTDDELTEADPENNVTPQTKRRRENVSTKQSGVASSNEMPPPTLGTASGKRHQQATRRSKRLSLDAHAYKPGPEAEETSTDPDSEATKGHRKKLGKRGIKRSRTSEFADPEQKPEEHTAKRPKRRASMSTFSKGDGQSMM